MKGKFITKGYALADPDMPSRLQSWFTGGSLEPDDKRTGKQMWKEVFDHMGRLELQEHARRLAAWIAMGAEPAQAIDENGKMEFKMTRPIGGCYMDVLFMDEAIRVMRANSGTVYVFARVPGK